MKRRLCKLLAFFTLITLISVISVNSFNTFAATTSFEKEISAFPESYKPYLRELHQKYPKWKFDAVKTNLDWYDVIAQESSLNRSLLPSSSSDYLKSKASGDYDSSTGKYTQKDSGFVVANEFAVAYFMDPRNLLNEENIFQFEVLSFSDSIKVETVEQVLSGTFMAESKITYYDTEGKKKSLDVTYAEAIYNAGKKYDVNPCYLASKIRNEVIVSGGKGSNSVTGTYGVYAGYYNFYNIGASDGLGAIARGLSWAMTGTTYSRPWTNPQKSIEGGAEYLAQSYIKKGQNTGYLQKFQVIPVSGSSLYSHQYMTNVCGADCQSYTTYQTYIEYDLMSISRVFGIPVYYNMPGEDKQTEQFSLLDSLNNQGVVNTTTLTVRSMPTTGGERIVTLNKGDKVTIIDKCRTSSKYYNTYLNYPFWYKIKVTVSGETCTGYVYAGYIDLTTVVNIPCKKTTASSGFPKNGIVNASSLNVRATPSVSGEKVCSVTNGKSVSVLSEIKTDSKEYPVWYKIEFSSDGNTTKGYVYKEYITIRSLSVQSMKTNLYYISDKNEVPLLYSFNTAVVGCPGENIINAYSLGTTTITAITSKGGFDEIKIKLTTDNTSKYDVDGFKYKTSGEDLTFSWNSVSGASGYDLIVFRDSLPVYAKQLTKTTGVVSGLPSSDKYSAKVRAYKLSSTERINGEFADLTVDQVKPQQVNGLLSYNISSSSFSIAWNKVAGASGYEVYKYNKESGKYALYTTTKQLSRSVAGLNPGEEYKLKVRAYSVFDGTKVYGTFSSEIAVKTYESTLSKLIQTSAGTDRIKLSWKEVSGAERYNIYLFNSEKKTSKKIGETVSKSYTVSGLEPDSKYTFIVAAIKTKKGSAYKYAGSQITAETTCGKPTGLYVSSSTSSSVTVKWNEYENAQYYRVYLYNAKDETYKFYKTVSENVCTVSALKALEQGYYAVRAGRKINGDLYFGSYSDTVFTMSGPKKVSGLHLSSVKSDSFTLKWNKLSGASVYYIYSCDTKSGAYKYIGKSSSESYTVKGTVAANKMYYKVRACKKYNGVLFKGSLSSAIEACILPEKVSSLSFKNPDNSSYTLKWNTANGADGYEIYKLTKGEYLHIASVKTTSYKVTELSPASQSSYKVRAYISLNGEKYFGEFCDAVKATTTAKNVTNLRYTQLSDESFKIAWTKSSGAGGYRIYRYDDEQKAYIYLATTTKSEYTVNIKETGSVKYKVSSYVKLDSKTYLSLGSEISVNQQVI